MIGKLQPRLLPQHNGVLFAGFQRSRFQWWQTHTVEHRVIGAALIGDDELVVQELDRRVNFRHPFGVNRQIVGRSATNRELARRDLEGASPLHIGIGRLHDGDTGIDPAWKIGGWR